MSVRCTDRTLPEAWLCFQLGWRDRESPVQRKRRTGGWVEKRSMWLCWLEGIQVWMAGGWRIHRPKEKETIVEKTLQLTLFQGRGHRTVGETPKNNPGSEKMRESERSILFSMIL